MERMWGLAENDAFIIGAIDSRKEIHIALKAKLPSLIDEEHLWSDEYGMSVLGHELVTLFCSEYEVAHDTPIDLGLVLHNRKQRKHKDMGDLMVVKKQIQDVDDLRKLLEDSEKPKAKHFIMPPEDKASITAEDKPPEGDS